MRRHTFSTESTTGKWSVEVSVDLPTSADETDLIAKRYGSIERVFAVANKGWTISCQNGMRKRERDAAVEYAADYRDDGSKDTFVPKLSADKVKEGKFTPVQLAIIKAAGMKFEQ
jgi:hypothetical protein